MKTISDMNGLAGPVGVEADKLKAAGHCCSRACETISDKAPRPGRSPMIFCACPCSDCVGARYARNKADATRDLTHGLDGPVSPFSLIVRAVEAARAGRYPADAVNDPIANALAEALEEFGVNLDAGATRYYGT